MTNTMRLVLAMGILGLAGCEEQKTAQFDAPFQEAKTKYENEQYQAAFADFKTLAEKGYLPAQMKMIEMLLDGEGVRRNEELAVEKLKQAAEKGEISAQLKLGEFYYSGELRRIPKDYHTALKWFNLAAERKNPDAQYKLGIMYESGNGVRQNKNSAKEWFGKACDNGSQYGCDDYRRLAEQGY